MNGEKGEFGATSRAVFVLTGIYCCLRYICGVL